MQIGDLLYSPSDKVFGIILNTEDDITFDYCWLMKEGDILMKEGFHYANIIEYWREAQKLKLR